MDIEYDAVGIFTGWTHIYSRYLVGQSGTGSNTAPNASWDTLSDIGLNLRPGETATVTVQKLTGTGSYNIWLALNWKELF